MTAYSNLKPAYFTQHIEALRRGEQPAPVHMQLVLSDLCNQDCHFCAYRSSAGQTSKFFGGNPNRKIPTDKAIEILEDAKALGVKAVQFTGGGEPTVHKDHREIIAHAQRLGLQTGLVTNGVLIKPHACFKRLDWIRISLDAGTAQTYAAIRKSSMWDRVMENLNYVRTLSAYKGIGFVITPENYPEIVTAAQIAHDFDYIRYSAVFSTDGVRPYALIQNTIRGNLKKARQHATVVDMFGDRLADLEQHHPDYDFCGMQVFTIYVGGNQKVYRCCNTAYTPHGQIGDLSKESLHDVHARGWLDDFVISNCPLCQFNQKNRIINSLIHEPMHVNFV